MTVVRCKPEDKYAGNWIDVSSANLGGDFSSELGESMSQERSIGPALKWKPPMAGSGNIQIPYLGTVCRVSQRMVNNLPTSLTRRTLSVIFEFIVETGCKKDSRCHCSVKIT